MKHPQWTFEREVFEKGFRFVAGVDEVGMGCLAGPVVAAAVLLNPADIPDGINDSKLITPKRREKIAADVRQRALSLAIGMASVDEIDSINIYQAARLAMRRAVESLSQRPDFLLIDGRAKIDLEIAQQSIIKGDQKSLSIGAASIIAKVFRDKMMEDFDNVHPGYGFAKHKGYGSVFHRTCLQEIGPSPIHRKSFSWKPVGTAGDSALS